MLKINIVFSIFIIFYKFINSSNALFFSLNYFYINNSSLSFFNNLYNSYLYTYIKIGEPEFIIKTLFSLFTPHFSISPINELIYDTKIANNYDINNSKTFQNISCLNRYYILSKYDIAAKEKFVLNIYNLDNKNISEIFLNDFDFILGVKNDGFEDNINNTYYLTLGLKQKESYRDKFNFVYLLKEKNITNNYNWFITYENIEPKKDELYDFEEFINVKAKLVIGDVPSNFEPKKFSDLESKLIKSQNYYWLLYFNKIYYYKNYSNNNYEEIKQEIFIHQGIIDINEPIIIAPNEYINYIKNDFFISYISKNICNIYKDNQIEGFFCEKSKNFNINNLKKFPPIYFEHKEGNYTFELTYKDLFIEKDNKFWFLIISENNYNQNWFLNYIFLRKYQFSFNPDSKIISFYGINNNEGNKNKINDKSKNRNYKKIIYISLILLSWIIFIIFGIIIGKIIYKKCDKKKRANELDDNYEYISEKNIN